MKSITTGLSPQCSKNSGHTKLWTQHSLPALSTPLSIKRHSMPQLHRQLLPQESSTTSTLCDSTVQMISRLPKTYISRQKTQYLERIHLDNEESMAKTLQSKLKQKEERQATVQRNAYKEVLLTLREIEELKKPLVASRTTSRKTNYRVTLRLKEYSKKWRKMNTECFYRNSLPSPA